MRHRGTSLRDKDGIYTIPSRSGELKRYQSVTSIIDSMDGGDMSFIHGSYIASEVGRLVDLHLAGQLAQVWSENKGTGVGWDQPAWLLDEVPAIEALKNHHHIKHSGWRQLRKDADRGSTVHGLISQWCSGSGLDTSEVPAWVEMTICEEKRSCSVDEVLPYALSALHWLEKVKPRCLHVDCPVFHDGRKGECSDGWGLYAGTLDFIGYLGGQLWLIDFKTSRASRRAHGMQLAAYKHARHIYLQGSNEIRPMVRVDGVMSVLIQPDGVTPRTWSSTQDWFKAFRHAIHAFNRLRGNMNVQTLKPFVTKTVEQTKLCVA